MVNSNPITSWIKGSMESAAEAEARFEDRVAEWVFWFLRRIYVDQYCGAMSLRISCANIPLLLYTLYSLLLSLFRASINAQKIVDESHNAYHPHQFWREERRTRGFDHFFVAHSSLKASPGGHHSSFKAANYYIDEAEAKRDELLKKYDKTTEYWNEQKFGVQEE